MTSTVNVKDHTERMRECLVVRGKRVDGTVTLPWEDVADLVDESTAYREKAAEIDRLRAVNTELVAALQGVVEYLGDEFDPQYCGFNPQRWVAVEQAAKAAVSQAREVMGNG